VTTKSSHQHQRILNNKDTADVSDYESFDGWLEDESGDVYGGSSERYGGGGYSFVSIR